MNDNNSQAFDYKTHILIGCTSSGKMTVICHWPHLPRQAEVQQSNGCAARRVRDIPAVHADLDHARERQRGAQAKSSPRLG